MAIDSASEACHFPETNAGVFCTFAGRAPEFG